MSDSLHKRFSVDGKYFAHLSSNGKLGIWNTASNSLEQEYTPDFHLNTPCTCLEFLQNEMVLTHNVSGPKKKKWKKDPNVSPHIVLGTTTGLLLIYSISKAAVEHTIDSNTNSHINCITTVHDNLLYSGTDKNILEWDLKKKLVKSQWKGGNEIICSILLIPNSKKILTAAKNIKLWNVETKEILKSFAGHSSDIICMYHIYSPVTEDSYLLTGSKDNHVLSCWNLIKKSSENNAICHFLMDDDVSHVSINTCSTTGVSNIAATTKIGSVHIYQHKLNEKCHKSIKHTTTIQIVADNENPNESIKPIPILAATYRDPETLCIGYGKEINLTFENIAVSLDKKMQCLIRKPHINNKISKKEQATKNRTAVIGNDVNYLSSQTALVQGKRKSGKDVELPMEQRLENLTLKALEPGKVPKMDNVGQLLLQGLHSKNRDILRSALCRKDENVIRNTVRRLPAAAFEEFIKEITSLIDGKTLMSTYGALWLKHFLQTHAGLLISNPNLSEMFSGILSSINTRIALQTPLYNLTGKLELLVPQISKNSQTKNTEDNDEALLVFNDKDSNSSDSEDEENSQENGIILDSEIEDWEENDNNEESMEIDSVLTLSDDDDEKNVE